jgi:hypothetical protein
MGKEGLVRFSAWCLCLAVMIPPSARAETLTLESVHLMFEERVKIRAPE